ncbi:hypothetical protein JX265_011269 [Neoarthrinium moseri]|uniref:Uncharacterized protein n=1 Tax=Neoarthrinium moseri TaxID=1658444 RepID=A0A9Q0AJQ3_9PEZI|nr:uncharacterized protein JN550_006366 [Neoarthrinium moseri]KAI1857068.1 hypothetical protein JX265_011269 [Neoarthrinium moseri]KAI1868450.1 hypothetical protein JN550_006366 [Neoarthrinium moseri]
MKSSAFLSVLATCTSGAVISARDTAVDVLPSTYSWDVINWQAGLSHGNPNAPQTGWYVFNVSSPETTVDGSTVPAFSAQCRGFAENFPVESPFADCTLSAGEAGSSVLARVYPTGDNTQCHMAVSYLTSGSDGIRNLTGYTTKDWARERAPYNFTITDIEIK